MGLTAVRNEVRAAMLDNHLTETEATRVIAKANEGVTFEVAKEVRDLFDRVNNGAAVSLSAGATPTGTSERGASQRLYGFLAAASVPMSNNHYIKQMAIMAAGWTTPKPLAQPPPLDRLFEVELGASNWGAERRVSTGFVDVESNEVYTRDSVIKDGARSDRWQGPFPMRQLGGTAMTRVRSTPQQPSPEISDRLKDHAAEMWMSGSKYVNPGPPTTAPSGRLTERFILGHASGTDTVVVANGDEAKFWVKRFDMRGASSFFGPFAGSDG